MKRSAGLTKCLSLGGLLFITLLGAYATICRAQTAQPARPNVLLIVMDDLRTNLGCYGDAVAVTPNIDRLARRGLLFRRAYAQQAVCNPSRASFLTGRRPDAIRVWNLTTHFRQTAPDAVPLPEHFKRHGYFTQGIGKIYHDPAEMQDAPSWSVPATLNVLPKRDDYLLAANQAPPDKPQQKMRAPEAAEMADDAYPDGKVAAAAVSALEQLQGRGQPFLLAVGLRKPHLPFSAPRKYWELYDRNKIPLPTNHSAPRKAPLLALHDWPELRGYAGINKQGALASAQVRELRHGYYAGTSYADAQVGKLLAALDRLRLTANTVVVLFSDHGFHLGEQGLWGKDTVYEAATRVPLIVSLPGLKSAGQRTEALVELIDVYPTLLELCGLPPPDRLDGRSFVPLLAQPRPGWKEAVFSQFPRPWEPSKAPQRMGYAVRTARFRYVEWRDFKTSELLARELYDYERGATETENLAAAPAYARQVAALRQLLPGGFATLRGQRSALN